MRAATLPLSSYFLTSSAVCASAAMPLSLSRRRHRPPLPPPCLPKRPPPLPPRRKGREFKLCLRKSSIRRPMWTLSLILCAAVTSLVHFCGFLSHSYRAYQWSLIFVVSDQSWGYAQFNRQVCAGIRAEQRRANSALCPKRSHCSHRVCATFPKSSPTRCADNASFITRLGCYYFNSSAVVCPS
jgi:hypothetical protein